MNAAIVEDIPADLTCIRMYQSENPLSRIGRKDWEKVSCSADAHSFVTILDYGCGSSLAAWLTNRGCSVTLAPYSASAEEILLTHPDGVILSDGAGNPADNIAQIETIRALKGNVPLMGIGLGHTMLALACGTPVKKMPVGHHGGSYPVRDMNGTRTYLTSQNHLYCVDETALAEGIVRYRNANDGECEGIDYPASRAFSVQFHPLLSSASRDTDAIMERFIRLMGGASECPAI
jgi:carbamoyl-phosphate synthase small subunit